MEPLNLKELDRLEREATEKPWQHSFDIIVHGGTVPWFDVNNWPRDEDCAFVAAARNQLRPLLDLVDRMGEVLADFVEAVPPNPDFIAEDGVKVYGLQVDELDSKHARVALDDYRRAKGE